MMIDYLLNNINKLVDVVSMVIVSLYFRGLLQYIGQTWIKTIAHTATLMLLPVMTYVITSVIAGNIALSLGLVGALSIVRFRNPVRSPLELSVYFGAITIGIATAVNLQWLLVIVGSSTFIAVTLVVINKISLQYFFKSFFIASFSEGNAMSTLNLHTSEEIGSLNSSEDLISKVTKNDQISYKLASASFDKLRGLEADLRTNKLVVSIHLIDKLCSKKY